MKEEKQKGKFIVLEGIDGAGKTVQAKLLKQRYEEVSQKAIVSREPGGTPVGEKIRGILLTSEQPGRVSKANTYTLDAETKLLLFASSASHTIRSVVKPALEKGINVILDRFSDSSYVYQGQELNENIIERVYDIACGDLVPDCVLILDITPEESNLRVNGRTKDETEALDLQFLQSLRNEYLTRALDRPSSHVVINGMKEPELVAANIFLRLIEKKLIFNS